MGPENMTNARHLKLLRQGVQSWNAWRMSSVTMPDLSRADLSGADLVGANLSGADLHKADLLKADLRAANLTDASLNEARLSEADLSDADLCEADLSEADLRVANLSGAKVGKAKLFGARLRAARLTRADLSDAYLSDADLSRAEMRYADLSRADLEDASLVEADLMGTNLSGARLIGANLRATELSKANLRAANLGEANLRYSNLQGADLSGANLTGALLVETDLTNAILTGCFVYGISAWNVKLSEGTKQQDLVITSRNEPEVRVDNVEVAHLIYLLLENTKIRDVIDTVGKKGVLLLGRFTEGRIAVLERLREELRNRGFLPIVFNFEKPHTKTTTETVKLLAGLSHFVIADVTSPRSVPHELQATVPEVMVPFQFIIEKGEEPFSMLDDFRIEHADRVLEPISYTSLDALVGVLDKGIIGPAQVRFDELVVRKAEKKKVRHV